MNKRKFDIRVFGLLTSVNGIMKGYYFDEGYLRTSSHIFNLDDLKNRAMHLTNDAIQKKDEDYCKFENANKISYQNFQKFLDTNLKHKNLNFEKDGIPQIKVSFIPLMF